MDVSSRATIYVSHISATMQNIIAQLMVIMPCRYTAPASKDIYSVLLEGMELGGMGGEPVENEANQLVMRAEDQAGCW